MIKTSEEAKKAYTELKVIHCLDEFKPTYYWLNEEIPMSYNDFYKPEHKIPDFNRNFKWRIL